MPDWNIGFWSGIFCVRGRRCKDGLRASGPIAPEVLNPTLYREPWFWSGIFCVRGRRCKVGLRVSGPMGYT